VSPVNLPAVTPPGSFLGFGRVTTMATARCFPGTRAPTRSRSKWPMP